ncbi:MAG: nucleoside 2-deoxyribosyltransferase [Oscillospiraceae bacterium]|nr:nucleoside 2-deoxyribosyltransferase [Oscillospiraceae bacterium]
MEKERIYIAGPMCFYEDGYPRWDLMRDRAKVKGFDVTMPNESDLIMDPVDLQKNAVTIFNNCARWMNETTAIICNLEFYRGPDVDGGSIYEMGMAYAKGAHCYGYTRDKRPMVWKYQGSQLKEGIVYDQKGRPLPYAQLPFSPNVVGACKIVEGDFDDCLQVFALDMEEKRKLALFPPVSNLPLCSKPDSKGMPIVYLAGPDRFEADAPARYELFKQLCLANGLYPIVPTDPIPGIPPAETGDPYTDAYLTFLRQQQHVRHCDILLADLNDFHGWEPDSDTSFECGMAFQLGKKLFGYMKDTRRMIERIPSFGPERGYRDACGCNAENFDFPINLMFAASMPIYQADSFQEALEQMAAALK